MREILELALHGSKRAGAKILSYYDNFKITHKFDNSPLTDADLASNDELFHWLSKSGYEICSEEQILDYEIRKNSSRFWLIDPLDGTREFIAKNGEFCVCVALIENGYPVLSVIFIPTTDEIFYSSGDGVYKNGKLLSTNVTFSNEISNNFIKNEETFCNNKIVLTGGSKISKSFKFAKEIGFDCIKIGSAIKFCKICEGKGAVYPRFGGSSLWDVAAGDFLVRQSGGALVGIESAELLRYDKQSLQCDEFVAINRDFVSNLDNYLSVCRQILRN